MKLLWLVCGVLLNTIVTKCQKPCSPKDPGPFLSTLPTLMMDIYEATQQDLDGAGAQNRYSAEVRVYGQVSTPGANEIVLEVMPDYTFMNPEDSFRFITRNQGVVIVLDKPLDRDGPTPALDDDINVFSFTLKCSLRSNASDFVLYDAKIFVMDVNDNSPQFQNLTSSLTVNELTPVNMTVLSVQATDKDLNNVSLTYSVVGGDMSSYFDLDDMGNLFVKAPLDYEKKVQGNLIITATDSGMPARTATATIQITVEDGNDQGPAFVYSGCWEHMYRCSWPKYIASNILKRGVPLSVMPVPNKVSGTVPIRAKDLDATRNPINFSIASTIPPGSESDFTVSTKSAGSGEYEATITPNKDMTVQHGFEIFLKAEEQASARKFEIAMILFEDANNACSTSSTASGQTSNNNSNNNSSNTDYSSPVIALIVVVSILAAFLFCLAIAFCCVLNRSRSSKSDDVTLTRM